MRIFLLIRTGNPLDSLAKDRTPPAPVPEADDEVPESDDDAAMHIANKAAMCALSDQELVEYAS